MLGVEDDMPLIAGAVLWDRGHAEEGRAVSRAHRLPNKAHGQWEARRAKVGPYRCGPEPSPWVSPGGKIPDGPWRGGWWVPRFTPGCSGMDATVMPEAEQAGLRITLRDYQSAALDAWLAAGGVGTVVAPCGSGKTSLGMGAISAVDSPCLVLVHTLDLARQWMERAHEQLDGVTVGLVGAGKKQDEARVVVATLQTLARWPWVERNRWGQRFGLVIQDEAHVAPAASFAEVLSSLPGRHRLGLTATPERMDGLGAWVYWSCGAEVYRIEEALLEEAGCTLAPLIRWLRTGWEPPGSVDSWVEIVNATTSDDRRNGLILEEVASQIERGRISLVLSDRVGHCHHLAAAIEERHGEGTAAALVGAVAKGKRAQILEDARSGRLRVVTATSVADEGLDVPSLETVILTCPSRNLGRVQQRIGRALRPAEDKGRPEVVDLVDDYGAAMGYQRKRAGLYRRLGWM